MTWYIEALGLPGPTRNADCGQSRIEMAYCSGRWKQHLSSEFVQVRVRVLPIGTASVIPESFIDSKSY